MPQINTQILELNKKSKIQSHRFVHPFYYDGDPQHSLFSVRRLLAKRLFICQEILLTFGKTNLMQNITMKVHHQID